MPQTETVIFADDTGAAPLLKWLDELPTKVQDKVYVKVERLAECGHELRRPEADFLRDGIYELRIRHMRVNYRILYFFHQQRAVLSHGITKEDRVPEGEIDLAVRRRKEFEKDSAGHTFYAE